MNCTTPGCPEDATVGTHCIKHLTPPETRILSEEESVARRTERANNSPGRPITMCNQPGCPHLAHYGPRCANHRQPAGPRLVVAGDLTDEELDAIRAEIDAKAAPLFLLAMDWLTRQQLGRLGVELPPGDAA